VTGVKRNPALVIASFIGASLHVLRHTAHLPSQIPAGCPAIGS